MGLGLHGGGVGVTKFFARRGARVTVTDLKPRRMLAPPLAQLRGLAVRYVLGRHREEDFVTADLVVQNPDVPNDSPYLTAARRHRVSIETDIGIFFELVPRKRIVGVTGTKGKSTTASLIASLLRIRHPGTVLAGNIRTSVLEVLERVREGTPVVLELSSWQLEGLARHRKSPHVAVITNVLQDHLNRHPTLRSYIEAKRHIIRFQQPGDYAVLNADLRRYAAFRSRVGRAANRWFSWRSVPKRYSAAWRLVGLHNLGNLAAALEVAKIYRLPQAGVLSALRAFHGLPGRLEQVRIRDDIRFYNDTTATAPDATIAAVRSFPDPEKLILIAGGTDKRLDYEPLGAFLAAYVPKALVLLPGTATDKLRMALERCGAKMPVIAAHSMSAAVRQASRLAQAGDAVVLSPGAASFGLFQHEFERGERFVEAVHALP